VSGGLRHRCAERHYLVHAHGNAALRATLARANGGRFFSLGQSFFQNISRCVRDTAVHRCADATRHQAPRPTGEDGDSESRSADTASDLSTPEKEARAAVGTGPSHKEEDDSDGWDDPARLPDRKNTRACAKKQRLDEVRNS